MERHSAFLCHSAVSYIFNCHIARAVFLICVFLIYLFCRPHPFYLGVFCTTEAPHHPPLLTNTPRFSVTQRTTLGFAAETLSLLLKVDLQCKTGHAYFGLPPFNSKSGRLLTQYRPTSSVKLWINTVNDKRSTIHALLDKRKGMMIKHESRNSDSFRLSVAGYVKVCKREMLYYYKVRRW